MSSLLSDYHYDLPPELIANRPTLRREDSKMLVLHRKTRLIEHRHFTDLGDYVTPDDLLVLNNSKVIPARLHDSTGKIEMLLMEKRDDLHWIAMVNPGKKMRVGQCVDTAGTRAAVKEVLDDGTRLLEFALPPDLNHYGEMPIPPYFHRAADEADRVRYQTVYAKKEGSIAAPTAGLHFTPEILSRFQHAFLTLHVGAGTFKPVKTEHLSEHTMHSEFYSLPKETSQRINQTKSLGGRIVAVGTTTTRVLESQPSGELHENHGSTDIFIYPPYEFRRVDVLLTNFHLPGSTLLMLISAFAEHEFILSAYAEAVRNQYRFFSYGDCMLIL